MVHFMSGDEISKVSIPTFIRSMLDPFVNVMGERSTPPMSKKLEVTFLDDHFRPTPQQLQAIGRVTTAWSMMELVMGMTIARLALAPEFTTLALTRELSANNQIRVLRMLIPLHAERYLGRIANSALIEELISLPAKITTLKDQRNIVCHTVWTKKNDDALIALRSKPLTASKSAESPSAEKTIADLNKLADDIQGLADHLFVLTQLLPAVDEAQHAQSLSKSVQSLHEEIFPKQTHQP